MTPLRVGLLVPFLLLSSSCSEETAEDHGVVKVEVRRASANDQPFVGTAEVTLRLTYNQCLHDFYTTTNTEWTPTGTKGGPAFQEWAERLCDPDDAGGVDIPDCTVKDISQDLGAEISTMRVTYTMNSEDIDLKVFRFGPLPVEDLTTDCAPEVQIDSGSVLGFDAAGTPIWQVQSLTSFPQAGTNQSGELWVEVVPSE